MSFVDVVKHHTLISPEKMAVAFKHPNYVDIWHVTTVSEFMGIQPNPPRKKKTKNNNRWLTNPD